MTKKTSWMKRVNKETDTATGLGTTRLLSKLLFKFFFTYSL